MSTCSVRQFRKRAAVAAVVTVTSFLHRRADCRKLPCSRSHRQPWLCETSIRNSRPSRRSLLLPRSRSHPRSFLISETRQRRRCRTRPFRTEPDRALVSVLDRAAVQAKGPVQVSERVAAAVLAAVCSAWAVEYLLPNRLRHQIPNTPSRRVRPSMKGLVSSL